jgi:hypothetical protein
MGDISLLVIICLEMFGEDTFVFAHEYFYNL